MARIQQKRGTKATLPTAGNLEGELLLTTDRNTLHAGKTPTTTVPITPAIDDLSVLATITGATDLLIIHDADGTGQKEKKITFDNFKGALNIPPASTDEKVSVASGQVAGYLDDVLEASTQIDKLQGTTAAKRKFTLKAGSVTATELAKASATSVGNGSVGNIMVSLGNGYVDWSNVIDCGTF